jgi:prephenate dehydrogenase
MTAEEHDMSMATIQNLPHIANILYFKTLNDLSIHPNDIENIAPESCKEQNNLASRIFRQQPSLFADMQIENKEFRKNILPIFKQNIEKLIYVINT